MSLPGPKNGAWEAPGGGQDLLLGTQGLCQAGDEVTWGHGCPPTWGPKGQDVRSLRASIPPAAPISGSFIPLSSS